MDFSPVATVAVTATRHTSQRGPGEARGPGRAGREWGLTRDVKTWESHTHGAPRAQEARGPGPWLCPGSLGLGTCYLPSGSQAKEELGVHDPQHSVTWSLLPMTAAGAGVILFSLTCFWLLTLQINEPRCLNQALEASLEGRGARGGRGGALTPPVSAMRAQNGLPGSLLPGHWV